MQSMPLLLRQSFRSSLNVSKRSSPRLRTPFSPSVTRPGALQATRQTTTRDFSVCLRYQFRAQPAVFSPGDPDRLKNEKNSVLGEKDAETRVDPDVEGQQQQSQQAQQEQWSTPGEETVNTQGQVLDGTTETNSNSDPTENGRLPSSLERRRSQYSKQFTEVMDNLQSNIFVAGQRLNDLTGYSSIEALKKEIQLQEERLRSARARIRESKEAYAAAINRRSASQREVNDLLQRKNNWSPADLERFTHLYRNDHTNEVAENDTQEALTLAEHDAEEASAALSKSILSRYHEEQVWSDKIRRMSTWGTWGLMGVNVLLFLIFQIAVEPWRRKRLVKGFEDKVIEAIEKERVLHQPEIADADADAHTGIDTSSLAITSETPAVVNESATSATPAVEVSESQPVADPTAASSPTESADKHTMNGYLEHWTHTWNDLLSNRTITITQRDLTTVAVQSAAAGAAVMGLVIALIRPR